MNVTLTGEGFHYGLSAKQLILKSTVVMDLPEAHITGQEGEAIIAESPGSGNLLVSRATICGGVVVTGVNRKKYKFDRAETLSATYTDSDGMLTLASPVTTWDGAEKGIIEGDEIKIQVTPDRGSSSSGPGATLSKSEQGLPPS